MSNLYKKSGVNINVGNKFVSNINTLFNKKYSKNVISGIGGFNSLFSIPSEYKNPVLVSGADGVGTKLLLAQKYNRHNTIGIDLVAMCVNDVITCGAKPLFFLDYISTGKLNLKTANDIIKGIIAGCEIAQCDLVGGETAEMPGMYNDEVYDLAGFCVGIIDKNKIISGADIKEGDLIIGLKSSGVHSNGFSLIRNIFKDKELKYIDELLTPTKIYVNECNYITKNYNVKGIAHITGGGFGNIERIIPHGLSAEIKKGSWPTPDIFKKIKDAGNVSEDEMYKVFNCGIGMVFIIDSKEWNEDFGFEIGKINKSLNGMIIK